MRRILLIASLVPLFLTCIPARAQNQSKFAAEFSDESAGSIAPQNGFGFGPAFVYGTNFQNGWRVRWSLDGVRSTNGSWRAGLYFKGYPSPSDPSIATQPIYSGYVQAISLSQIDFFGLGNFTSTKGRSFFGMREIIPGASILYPISRKASCTWLCMAKRMAAWCNFGAAVGNPAHLLSSFTRWLKLRA